MTDTRDELAGVVDLFGGLTRDELEQALVELAFKQGKEVEREAFADEIERAVADYYLVETERGVESDGGAGEPLLVAGPAAFPTVPENGEDLPHILDVPTRSVDREAAAETVVDQLRQDAATAVDEGDEERAAHLADVTYDLEAWGPVDLAETRDRLVAVTE